MCGLIGIISKNVRGFFPKHVDIVAQLLYADAMRGWDATGVFGITQIGNIDIVKKAAPAGVFLQTEEYKTFSANILKKYHIVIGHNRKATHGEKNHEDAHPFWDKENKICLVHNGVITNHKTFCPNATVDSAAICNALAKTTNVEQTLQDISGAYALIWYNIEEKKLYFVRNTQRPLYLLETADTYILASEDSLAYWIAKRNADPITTCTEVATDTLYSLCLETKKVVEEKKIEKKAFLSPTIIPTPGTNTSIINHPYSFFGGLCPDHFYYTDKDYADFSYARRNFKTGTEVLFRISTYEFPEEHHSHGYIEGHLLNAPNTDIKIRYWLKSKDFNALALTDVYLGKIVGITSKGNSKILFIEKPIPQSSITTLNDIDITKTMWNDDRFPADCNCCNTKLPYPALPYSEVELEGGSIDSLLCTSCLETIINV